MNQQYFSVAIDGPAGAGKSTIARKVAATLGFVYVDTGAIYRTVACAALRYCADPADRTSVEAILPNINIQLDWQEDGVQHMILDGEDVTSEIRRPEISGMASVVSAMPAVRQFLLDTQRNVARTHNVIMDGRDIGTVVLPDADVKIYLSASAEVRAKRRWLELQARGRTDSYEEVLKDMQERDWRDMHREIAPLRQAEDAIAVDTSALNLEESVSAIKKIIREKLTL